MTKLFLIPSSTVMVTLYCIWGLKWVSVTDSHDPLTQIVPECDLNMAQISLKIFELHAYQPLEKHAAVILVTNYSGCNPATITTTVHAINSYSCCFYSCLVLDVNSLWLNMPQFLVPKDFSSYQLLYLFIQKGMIYK